MYVITLFHVTSKLGRFRDGSLLPDAKPAICWRCGFWGSYSSSQIPYHPSSDPSSSSIAQYVPPSTCAISSRTCCTHRASRVSVNVVVSPVKMPKWIEDFFFTIMLCLSDCNHVICAHLYMNDPFPLMKTVRFCNVSK